MVLQLEDSPHTMLGPSKKYDQEANKPTDKVTKLLVPSLSLIKFNILWMVINQLCGFMHCL